MRSFLFYATALLACASSSYAVKQWNITVGHNTTDDGTTIFQPNEIKGAEQGDIIFFNFTRGNHTATQSTFASPCTAAHFTDASINGFDTSFRPAGNGTTVTSFNYVVNNPNETIWFFDWNTCATGGVGAINVNESSWETFDGFQRNAVRLNGTDPTPNTTTSSFSRRPTSSSTGQPTHTNAASSTYAQQAAVKGFTAVLPLLAVLGAIGL